MLTQNEYEYYIFYSKKLNFNNFSLCIISKDKIFCYLLINFNYYLFENQYIN